MGNRTKYDGWAITAIIVIALTTLLVAIMPSILTNAADPGSPIDFTDNNDSSVGDTIGGITAPFVGVGAAFLTFIAFWVQYKFNQEQSLSLKKERVEHNFYEMLQLHESITSSSSLIVFSLTSDKIKDSIKGRDVFQFFYNDYPINKEEHRRLVPKPGSQDNKDYKGIRELMANETDDRFKRYKDLEAIGSLDHYFRQLYRIFKYIDDAQSFLDEKERYSYVGIARSTLSYYELVMIFYNSLSNKGKDKFKPLIEKYAILKNLSAELLAIESDYDLYNRNAYRHVFKECH